MHKTTLMACLLACTFVYAPGASAQVTASSVDKVPALIKTPAGKATWDREMVGKPQPDGMGVNLPDGLTAEAIKGLLLPADDRGEITLVGAKPWARRANSYVAIVCSTGEPVQANRTSYCEENRRDTLAVYVGVIEMVDGAPQLIAASGPLDRKVSWNATSLPGSPIASQELPDGAVMPARWDRFDLAPYKITKDSYAFGLRASWADSYAGGGASYEALYLLAIAGKKLRVIFSEPMSAFENLAGDWNPDHTREHHITEGELVLAMTTRLTAGHYDMQLKSRLDGLVQPYKWSTKNNAYRAVAEVMK